jgi:hypothetical protein
MAGLDGSPASVTVTLVSEIGGVFGVAYPSPGNTGDFARLLNDAASVGTVVAGGRYVYTFAGVSAGIYDLFTYAVNVVGHVVAVPVTVPESIGMQTQVVTGPMPGDAFALGVTHSIHRVVVASGATFRAIVEMPAGATEHYNVNGFQLAAVPEQGTLATFCGWVLLLLIQRSRKK